MRALPGRRSAVVFATTVAFGAAAGTAAAAPSITVSKPADLKDGDSLTVKGAGFDATAGRGVYVLLTSASYAPRTGAPNGGQVWQSTINADGSFTAELPVSASFSNANSAVDCRTQACTVRTVADHRNPGDRSQDASRGVNFRSPTSVDAVSGNVDWGYKESFRQYVQGPFANGSITPSGGATSNADGTFDFPFVNGSVDPAAGSTYVQTRGSVTFTGHGGVLNTTIADVRVLADGTDRRLIADVTTTPRGSTQPTTYEDVDLADLDQQASPLRSATQASWVKLPATVSASGSAAAGYGTGEALDPVTFFASSIDEPALQPAPAADPAPDPAPAPAAPAAPAATTPTTPQTSTAAPATSPSTTAERPALSRASLSLSRLRFRVSEGSTVTARIQRQVTKKVRRNGRTRTVRSWSTVRTLETTKRTAGTVSLKPRIGRAGLYRITLRATSTDGVEGEALVVKQRITSAQVRAAKRAAAKR